jgi:DNA-binding transcriptional regulator YhcF (GntR family)
VVIVPIRDNDPRPAYEQLADELRQAITTGEYEPGDRLPSTRELSESHGIAPMTVRNALKVLEDEQLVVARQGRGVFVRTPAEAVVREPLGVVRQQLDKAMEMLRGINDRLDRYEAAQPSPGQGKETPGTEAGVDLDASMVEIIENLAEANAALDEAEALGHDGHGYDHHIDHGLGPDRGHDLGL